MLQVMVTNVTSLLKTVKAVEDEHTRGTRALESTIEAMGQEMRVNIYFYYFQYLVTLVMGTFHSAAYYSFWELW